MADYVCERCHGRSRLADCHSHLGDMYGVCENCEDAEVEAGREELRAQGRAEERAAIVKWLRTYADDENTAPALLGDDGELAIGYTDARRIATAIEAGKHREG